jgi:hypothetical protein
MNEEIKELLKDIIDYFYDNDLECGEQGGEILNRINAFLKNDTI